MYEPDDMENPADVIREDLGTPCEEPMEDMGDDDCDVDDSMDGDHDSAMESIGWGTDEDYGYYGGDDDY